VIHTPAEWRSFRYAFAHSFILAFCAFSLVLLAANPAYAQSIDTVPFAVDFTPLAEQAVSVMIVVLTALAGVVSKFAISWLASKTNMQDGQAEALLAERVNDILLKSIDYAEMWAKRELADNTSGLKNVQIDNFFVRTAVQYAMRSMPDLIIRFNLTEDRIGDMIRSRLNNVTRTPVADSGKVEMVVQ
jgi:hypothetical protein